MTKDKDEDLKPKLTHAESRKLRKEAQEATDRTDLQSLLALKKKVRMLYDLQRIRIQVGGRNLIRPTKPGEDEVEVVAIDLHDTDLAILDARQREFLASERAAERDVEAHIRTIPIGRFLLDNRERYKGLGVRMIGVILSEFTIERHDTVSKMWAYAGLRPMPCKRCKHCSGVVEEADAVLTHKSKLDTKACRDVLSAADVFDSGHAQKPTKGEKLPYNAWLRTKLVGVLGPNLIKCGSPWRKFYDDYKHRKTSAGWGKSDGHRHNAAVRYMIKMLLQDIWREWRALEGLEVRPSYQEEYLGKKHSAA